MSERDMPEGEGPEPETNRPYVSRIDRRTTLAWLGAAITAIPAAASAQSTGAVPTGAGHQAPPAEGRKGPVVDPPPNGYGTDPDLFKTVAPWPRLMSKAQLQTAALLCDFILPASGKAPSANALHVPDFIDEWVSAPYPAQASDRPVVLAGLDWVEAEARRRFGKGLFDLAAADRTALLTPLTARSSDPAMQTPHAFFRRFRSLTIGAYYTTQAGFRDIGYIGNVARVSDPGPSQEVKAALDVAFKKLGI